MKRSLFDRAAWAIAGALSLLLVAALAGIVRGGPLDPPGAPAPTSPLVEPRTPISATGYVITQPGSYYLTKDVTASSGQTGISITVSDVAIDLNGFTLRGVVGAGDGINVGIGVKNVAVRNGAISSWPGYGISGFNAEGGRYEALTLASNSGGGISAGKASIIRDCVVKENGGVGIEVNELAASDGSIIENCVVQNSVLDGIGVANNVTVRDNQVIDNGRYGVYAYGSGNRIDGNTIKPGLDKAIKVDGLSNIIIRNMVRGALSDVDIANGNTKGGFETGGTPLSNPWANITY